MKNKVQMNPLERLVICYLVLFLLLGVYLAIFNQLYFDTIYTIEDGFLESLTVVALFTTAAVCFKRAFIFRSTQGVQFVLINMLFSLIFFLAAGEEISWGQRIFNWESNEFFLQFNAQEETNFHNLTVNGIKINQLIFGLGFSIILLTYLLILTPLYNNKPKFRTFMDSWGIPMPKHYQVLGYFVVAIAVEVIIKAFSDTGRRGELTEFVTSFWVLLNVAYPSNILLQNKDNIQDL